jgi:hypothetical protein
VAGSKKGAFADLLDGTFTMLSRTWLTTLILGGVLFIPTSFFIGWSYGTLLDAFKGFAAESQDPAAILVPLGIAYLWIALAALVQGLVYLYVRACVTEHAARAARGETATPGAVAAFILRGRYARLLGQRVVQMMILSITLGAATLIASAGIGVAMALGSTLLAVLIGAVFGAAGLGVFTWIAVRYMVTLESVVIDDMGIDQSFDHSMALVGHRWWRVFGYTLLFGLMVSFASSIIATPVMFFSNIRGYMHSLELVLKGNWGDRSFNQVIMQLFAGLGRRLGILQYVQSLLGSLVTPVFMTLLFLDLKKQPATSQIAEQDTEAAL